MRYDRESKFRSNDSGAVAAAYALALPALIGVAALGFDYARLAGMDSELQNGADQAALAAASQLNGKTGACARASAAAVGLVANQTLLASGANAVTVPAEATCDAVGQIRFFQDKTKSTAATSDSNARFVEISMNARTVDYALFPVIGLVSSGDITGTAFAGLGSAICKLPPVMMCNPAESTDPSFTTLNYLGKGIRLVANDGGGGYGPGNFGYLENASANGAPGIAAGLGLVSPPGDCIQTDGVTTKPGAQVSVLNALNTRFDIYENGTPGNVCNNQADCPPSANARIDLVRTGNGNGSCGVANGNGAGYKLPANPYLPTSGTNPLSNADADALSPMGYPRDMCHAISQEGNCVGARIGDGNWDRNAYFRSNSSNYPAGSPPGSASYTSYGDPATPSSLEPTRYQIYRYEYANSKAKAPSCQSPGIPPSATPDRRVLSIAVINCTAEGVGGATPNVDVVKFVDGFLTEPSANRGNGSTARTEKSDVYVEIIGETTLGGGGTQGQEIRKDTPYLIE